MDKFNPEGIEGDVIVASPFLLDEDIRCTNETCPIKSKCLRYLQFIEDKKTNFEGLKASFFQAISSLEYFDYENNGFDKFIKK